MLPVHWVGVWANGQLGRRGGRWKDISGPVVNHYRMYMHEIWYTYHRYSAIVPSYSLTGSKYFVKYFFKHLKGVFFIPRPLLHTHKG